MADKVVTCLECYEREKPPCEVVLCPDHAQAERWKALAQEALTKLLDSQKYVHAEGSSMYIHEDTEEEYCRFCQWKRDLIAKARELGLEVK